MKIQELAGHDLGTRLVSYTEFDAILYALSVGAKSTDLDLVYEKRLHVLPTYSLALANWVTEAAGDVGVYDRNRTLHGSQVLTMKSPLPPSGKVETSARIGAVYDKGKAAVVRIDAESEFFTATYTIFVPGFGGWGGDRGPASPERVEPDADAVVIESSISPEQAALYRLTGDVHPVHIDPEVAGANGFSRPILHGLCTLGVSAREMATAVDAAPWELSYIEARFSQPVLPGTVLETTVYDIHDRTARFRAQVAGETVLQDGSARF